MTVVVGRSGGGTTLRPGGVAAAHKSGWRQREAELRGSINSRHADNTGANQLRPDISARLLLPPPPPRTQSAAEVSGRPTPPGISAPINFPTDTTRDFADPIRPDKAEDRVKLTFSATNCSRRL